MTGLPAVASRKSILVMSRSASIKEEHLSVVARKIASEYRMDAYNAHQLVQNAKKDRDLTPEQIIECACTELAHVRHQSGTAGGFVLYGFSLSSSIVSVLGEKDLPPTDVLFLGDVEHPLHQESSEQPSEEFDAAVSAMKEVLIEANIPTLDLPDGLSPSDAAAAAFRSLNPFELRVDDEEDGLIPTGDDIIPGDCADFCPVTWVDQGRLVPGKPEYVLYIRQKRYCFVGEEQAVKFRRNPRKYVPSQMPKASPPCVLLLGVDGCGICDGRRIVWQQKQSK